MLDLEKNEIDIPIRTILKGFTARLNSRLQNFPVLSLNGFWPSLGVVDLYTFSLRYKGLLSELEKAQYQQSASYIAYVISDLWSDLEIQNQICLDEFGQVVINYNYNEKTFVLRVEDILFQILSAVTGSIEVTDDFSRPYSFDSNIIPILTFGLVSGLSPLLPDSPWRKLAAEEKSSWLNELDKVIARQISRWFAEAFPKLELSHVPELYLNGLISPKFLMEEESPFVSSVDQFFTYCSNYKIPRVYINEIIKAFSFCPDEQINIHSVCLSGIFKDINQVPNSVISSAGIYRYAMPFIGKSLRRSLELNGVVGDWVTNPELKESEIVFEYERELAIQPWVTLPLTRLRTNSDKGLTDFIKLASHFMFEDAGRQLMKLVEETPSDIDLRIQHIKFEMIRGDFEYAHDLCKTLISEPGAESYPSFFNIWGLCLLELGEPDLAARYFRAAKGNIKVDSVLKGEILNNLAWSNIQLGMLEESKALLLEAEHFVRSPLTVYLNMAFIFSRQNDPTNRDLYINKAQQIAPTDRRVFANLLA